jgi:predicted PurR-regulated permease PerM
MSDSPLLPPPDAAERRRRLRALGLLALAASACLIRLALPEGIGLFLGALVAFTLLPAYEGLRQRGMRPGPAALICALGATIGVSGIVAGFSTLLVTRGIALLGELRGALAQGGPLRAFAEGAASRLTALHVNVPELLQRIENEAMSLGTEAASFAAEVAGTTFSALLLLLFMTLAAYFVLRHWPRIVSRAELLLPFEARHTHALLDQFRSVGRQVLLGTVVTGLVQGLFGAIGYWIFGVPEPAFFGALTALASLVPGVGTLIVWVTVGVVLILEGRVGAGLLELTYGAVMVGIVCDYVIRPRLVGREGGVPAILTFLSLFGGVEVFGVIGLVLGPVIGTLSYAVIRTYAQEVEAERDALLAAPRRTP